MVNGLGSGSTSFFLGPTRIASLDLGLIAIRIWRAILSLAFPHSVSSDALRAKSLHEKTGAPVGVSDRHVF